VAKGQRDENGRNGNEGKWIERGGSRCGAVCRNHSVVRRAKCVVVCCGDAGVHS
jgi:hypothetical protein